MKQSQPTTLLWSALVISFLFSCGTNGERVESDTTMIDSMVTTTTQPVNTVVTTPQNMVIVMHRVADFNKWKASYDAHDSMRLANGMHSYVIGRGVKDSNMVMVVVKADDMEKAKTFAKDASLKKAMQEGGVRGTPTFKYIVMTWQDTSYIGPEVIRTQASINVNDWNAWRNHFEQSRQTPSDNGLALRAYGHEEGNDKKVVIVSALQDSAKAAAWWQSDNFKNRMTEGGVVGQPDRFMFRIAARY